jgi:predicted transcriptional regulator
MSTVELKNKLKEKIDSLEEDYLLEHLIGIIEIETSDDEFKIPEVHKRSIDRGIAQIKAGQGISNDEVMERVRRWVDK